MVRAGDDVDRGTGADDQAARRHLAPVLEAVADRVARPEGLGVALDQLGVTTVIPASPSVLVPERNGPSREPCNLHPAQLPR